jgi:hypothetical protein
VAQVNEVHLNVLEPYQIVQLASERKGTYAERDRLYEIYQKYYRGRQASVGPSMLAANSQGRPLLRVGESVNASRGFTTQRLAPIVDDNQALLGRMPAVRVEPPDPSSQGIDRGELLTKYLISTHELSSMDRQQAEMGYYLPCLGDGCYLLEAEPDLRRVTWTVVDPSTAYPSFMSGYQRYEVLDLIIHYLMDPYAARARWGSHIQVEEGQRSIPVTMYISKHQRSIVVGMEDPELVQHMEWSLRFCPAVWVFNKLNGQMANSDIAQSLEQQDALDFLWVLMLEGAVQNTYPIIGVRNPLSLSGEPIQVGPGAPPVALGPDGAITVSNSQGSLESITFGMQSLISEINVSAGTSQMRQEGSLHSSLPTGRAMHAAQGPQATRVELKQTELGAAIRRANEMTLEMQEKAPLLGSHEFEIYGRYKGQSFLQKMKGSDIDGWYRNSVYWDPVTGMNQQQKTAVAYEAKAAGLVDSIRAMEMTGEDDPEGMLQRVRREKLKEAELQGQMQAMMQGAGTPVGAGVAGGGGAQSPPPQAPATTPSQGQPPSPPTMIARPPGLGADRAQQPMGGGVTQAKVEEALKVIADRLKGSVALVGEPATHVSIIVSDTRDSQRVLPVVRLLDPRATVKVAKESEWPTNAIRVA